MPSVAWTAYLEQLLLDAVRLDELYAGLRGGGASAAQLAVLNRSAVVASVSAWESYIEELMRESLRVLRPPPPLLGAWPALSALVLNQLGRFNNPSPANVARLIQDCLGLADVRPSWGWQNCTPAQAEQRLTDLLTLRHQIAHGVNPRPSVPHSYTGILPGFIRRLARCTDDAVRQHLVTVHGSLNPWPA